MEASELFDDDGRIRADDESPLLLERLHRALAWWNVRRLRAEQPTRRWRDENEEDLRMRSLEGEWIEGERAALAPWIREVPRTSGGFLRWFESLQLDRHGHRDAMPGSPAGPVTLDEVRWWMRQELAAGSGLEAVMALLRLRLPDLPEVARAVPVAGRERLVRLGRLVGVESEGLRAVWESLAVANLDVALAFSRHHAWHAVGALGAVVLTAADRTNRFARALRRLGLDVEEADLPGERAQAARWLRAVLVPRVDEDPDRIPWLAEGAMLRLRAAVRSDRRCWSELGLSEPDSDASGPTPPPWSR